MKFNALKTVCVFGMGVRLSTNPTRLNLPPRSIKKPDSHNLSVPLGLLTLRGQQTLSLCVARRAEKNNLALFKILQSRLHVQSQWKRVNVFLQFVCKRSVALEIAWKKLSPGVAGQDVTCLFSSRQISFPIPPTLTGYHGVGDWNLELLGSQKRLIWFRDLGSLFDESHFSVFH